MVGREPVTTPRKEILSDGIEIWLGDCRDVLPLIGRVDAVVTDLAVGTAAEHLVCADLIIAGYRAFLSDQNCPYDVAVDIGGRLIRIQVKATRGPKAIPQRVGHFPAYMWHVRRAGRGGKRTYSEGEFDLLALVAIDCKKIAYLAPSNSKQTIHIRPHDNPLPPQHGGNGGKVFSQFPFSSALAEAVNAT